MGTNYIIYDYTYEYNATQERLSVSKTTLISKSSSWGSAAH